MLDGLDKRDPDAVSRAGVPACVCARAALAIIETYDRARVDRLCRAIAWAVSNKKTFTNPVAQGIADAALNTRLSKSSDFGSVCSADANLIVQEGIFAALAMEEGEFTAADMTGAC